MNNDLISRTKLIEHINQTISDLVIKGELQSYEVYDTIISIIRAEHSVDIYTMLLGKVDPFKLGKCSNCYAENDIGSQYCSCCGARLGV